MSAWFGICSGILSLLGMVIVLSGGDLNIAAAIFAMAILNAIWENTAIKEDK